MTDAPTDYALEIITDEAEPSVVIEPPGARLGLDYLQIDGAILELVTTDSARHRLGMIGAEQAAALAGAGEVKVVQIVEGGEAAYVDTVPIRRSPAAG